QHARVFQLGVREIAAACQVHQGDKHPLLVTAYCGERQRFLGQRTRMLKVSLVEGGPHEASEHASRAMLISHLSEERQRLLVEGACRGIVASGLRGMAQP